jgi:hypothetical protein
LVCLPLTILNVLTRIHIAYMYWCNKFILKISLQCAMCSSHSVIPKWCCIQKHFNPTIFFTFEYFENPNFLNKGGLIDFFSFYSITCLHVKWLDDREVSLCKVSAKRVSFDTHVWAWNDNPKLSLATTSIQPRRLLLPQHFSGAAKWILHWLIRRWRLSGQLISLPRIKLNR